MTNNRQVINYDFIVPYRNNSYGVRINWENTNPIILVSRGVQNVFRNLVNVDQTFRLPIDPNYAWSNIPNYVREYLHQRHIEYLRSLSADQISNLSAEDLELLIQERA